MTTPARHWTNRSLRGLAVSALIAALAACGGGGGDGPGAVSVHTASLLAPSASLANVCTLTGEQTFVRSYLDETYLWWDRVPAVDPAAHWTLPAYFSALLVKSPDGSGRSTDRFSTVVDSAVADAMLLASGSPSAAALSTPTASVPLVSSLATAGGRKVGYVLFNRHGRGAQDALIAAVEALQTEAVQDLVLDLRNNPGGYLYVAQTLASMVAGHRYAGQVFEQLQPSDKRRLSQREVTTLRFSAEVTRAETVYPAGYALPQLALPRLYVLASGMTCSASESIVNSLRGIGIEVIVVGGTTCGKPYGFYRKDNCGRSYFAIEFRGVNAQGFGDYTAGFAPQCAIAEDPSATLGSLGEPLLAAALHHIDTGMCPAAAASTKSAASPAPDPNAGLLGRLLEAQ